MTWNYRVVRDTHLAGEEEHWYTIREVYYHDDGKIASWTAKACYPSGDDLEELRKDLSMMVAAFALPVIDISDESRPREVPPGAQG